MKNELFSPIETEVLKILGYKKRTVGELAALYFFSIKKNPIDPNAVVSAAILRINKKCEYHKLPWFLNSYGLGRGGKTVWRDKKPIK